MTNSGDQLFTTEEVFFRLGQNKDQGCLLVSKGAELVTIYVKNGTVLSATSGHRTGKEAIDHALHLADATHQWVRGVQPPNPGENIRLNIQEFIVTNGRLAKDKVAETGRMRGKPVETPESQFTYFLVPEHEPTVKLILTKTATVLGRTKAADLIIEDFNVSARHCILDVQIRGLFILDLDSTNGTYVNGVLVRDGYVNPGDVIELGDYRLRVNRELRK
jgi:hypothetical protein